MHAACMCGVSSIRGSLLCCACLADHMLLLQVCTTAAETVAELACCLGLEWVPAEYGGPCTRAYDEFPAQQALLQHVAKLHLHSA